jgi:hypothetical protein
VGAPASFVCGRMVSVARLSLSAPILCEAHAWTAQQEQADRRGLEARPPPGAYREVRLEEN